MFSLHAVLWCCPECPIDPHLHTAQATGVTLLGRVQSILKSISHQGKCVHGQGDHQPGEEG